MKDKKDHSDKIGTIPVEVVVDLINYDLKKLLHKVSELEKCRLATPTISSRYRIGEVIDSLENSIRLTVSYLSYLNHEQSENEEYSSSLAEHIKSYLAFNDTIGMPVEVSLEYDQGSRIPLSERTESRTTNKKGENMETQPNKEGESMKTQPNRGLQNNRINGSTYPAPEEQLSEAVIMRMTNEGLEKYCIYTETGYYINCYAASEAGAIEIAVSLVQNNIINPAFSIMKVGY